MITGFNPSVSNNKSRIQKQKFGSFPVPRDSGDSQVLLDKVGMGKIKPTPDNLESLKKAFKEGGKSIQGHLEEIVEHWKLNLEDFKK